MSAMDDEQVLFYRELFQQQERWVNGFTSTLLVRIFYIVPRGKVLT